MIHSCQFHPIRLLLLSLIALIFLNPSNLFAQKENQPYQRVQRWLDSADLQLKEIHPNEAIQFVSKARKDIKEHQLYSSNRRASIIVGGANILLSNYNKARKLYSTSLTSSLRSKDTVNILKCYHGLGLICVETMNWTELDRITQEFNRFSASNHWASQRLDYNRMIARSLLIRKKYMASIRMHYSITEELKKQKDTSALISAYFNLSTIYAELQKHDHAIYFLKKCQKLNAKKNNDYINGSILNSIAGIETNSNRPDDAIVHYLESIHYFKKSQYTLGISYSAIALAIIYEQKDDLENAQKYASLALVHGDESTNSMIKSIYHLVQTKIELRMNKLDEALKHTDSSYFYAHLCQDVSRKIEVMELKADIYARMGDYKNAHFYTLKFNQTKDSLTRLENISHIENVELLRSLESSEKENRLINQNLDLKRKAAKNAIYWSVFLIGTSALLLILFTFLYWNRLKRLRFKHELVQNKYDLEVSNQTILQLQLENKLKQNELLEKDLQLKNTKIQELAYRLTKKNNLLQEFSKEQIFDHNRDVLKLLNNLIESDKETHFFNQEILLLESNFHQRLKNKFPDLSEYEVQLSTMIKIGLRSKEIAELLFIEPSSVDVSRHRLRKKMNLDKTVDLYEFLSTQ